MRPFLLAALVVAFMSLACGFVQAFRPAYLPHALGVVVVVGLVMGWLLATDDGTGRRATPTRAADLWNMNAESFEHMAVLIMQAMQFQLYRRERHGDFAMFAGRDPAPMVGGYVFVLVAHTPEVTAPMVQGLATRMRAHGSASGLIIASGVVQDAARAAAGPWRIRFVDGEEAASILSGGHPF